MSGGSGYGGGASGASAPESFTLSLPGTTSLVDEIDKRLLIVLRDGKKLIGTLRSYDQYANLILEDALERVIVGQKYGDVPLGLFIIRGENVALVGELDLEIEAAPKPDLTQVTVAEILELQRAERESQEGQLRMRKRIEVLLDDMY